MLRGRGPSFARSASGSACQPPIAAIPTSKLWRRRCSMSRGRLASGCPLEEGRQLKADGGPARRQGLHGHGSGHPALDPAPERLAHARPLSSVRLPQAERKTRVPQHRSRAAQHIRRAIACGTTGGPRPTKASIWHRRKSSVGASSAQTKESSADQEGLPGRMHRNLSGDWERQRRVAAVDSPRMHAGPRKVVPDPGDTSS